MRRNISRGTFAFLGVFILFAALKAFQLVRFHDVLWDEAVFIGMGKFLYSGGSAGLWEPLRPVVLPLILGAFSRLDAVFWAEVIAILFGAGCLYLTYRIGSTLWNTRTGLLACILLGMTPLFFFFSSYALSSIPSAFFALLSLFYFLRGRHALSGIFAGISFLTRFPMGLLLPAFFFLYLFREKLRGFFAFVSLFGAVTAVFLVFNTFLYGNPLLPFLSALPHQYNMHYAVQGSGIAMLIRSLLFYPLALLSEHPLFLLVIFGLIPLFSSQGRKRPLIMLAFLIPFLLYFTLIPNKQDRFLLVIFPYLCLLAASGFFFALAALRKRQVRVRRLLMGILAVFCVWSLLFTGSTLAEHYSWRPSSPSPAYTSFYLPLGQMEFSSYVLTATPIPAVYSDALFIPFYNSADDAVSTYQALGSGASAIVYTSEFYPCLTADCIEKEAYLERDIMQSRTRTLFYNSSEEFSVFI